VFGWAFGLAWIAIANVASANVANDCVGRFVVLHWFVLTL
jgi:hypothetical protein